jgi:hypothetical protein
MLALVAVLAATGAKSRVSAQEVVIDERFGAVDAHLDPNGAAESRVGWERVTFDWGLMEPGPSTGVLNTGLEQEWFTDARSSGREIVGLLINTPVWATEGRPDIGVPAGLYLSPSDPGNVWARFVREVVGIYGQRGVNHWIIWDNPNIPSAVYGHGWEGSIQDYYQLVKVAYIAAKEANPNAQIHLAGYSQTYDAQWLQKLMDVIVNDPTAPDNNFYFDSATLHLYYDTGLYSRTVANAFLVMQQNEIFKDIWIVESGAYPPDIALREYPEVTPDQHASFVIQSAALGLAAGVQRVGVDHFVDARTEEGDILPGLLDPAGGTRPAYASYGVVTEYFAGWQAASHRQLDFVEYVRIRHGDRVTHVAWARTAQPAMLTIPNTSQTATLVDQRGNAQTITSSDGGGYVIRLEGANCNGSGGTCPIGGPVLLLVESGFDPYLVPTPPAPIHDAPAPTLAPGEATATPLPTPTTAPTATATSAPVAEQAQPEAQPTEAAAPVEPAPAVDSAPSSAVTATPTFVPPPAPTPIPPPPTGAAAAAPFVLVGLGTLVIGGGLGFWLRDRRKMEVMQVPAPDDGPLDD